MNKQLKTTVLSVILLSSFGQSIFGASTSIATHMILRQGVDQVCTLAANHVYGYRYVYGAVLGTVAAVTAIKKIRALNHQNFRNRVTALEDLGFLHNTEKMARAMSMEKIESLRNLLNANVSRDRAKSLNKQYLPSTVNNIALLFQGRNMTLDDAIAYATQFPDQKVLLTIKTSAAAGPKTLAQCLQTLTLAKATQDAADTTARGMRDAAHDHAFYNSLYGNHDQTNVKVINHE